MSNIVLPIGRLSFPHLRRKETAPRVVYVIAAGEQAANALALLVAAKRVPELYLFACDCLQAWRASPLPCHSRYQPWAVTLEAVPSGFSVKSSKRLDTLDPDGAMLRATRESQGYANET